METLKKFLPFVMCFVLGAVALFAVLWVLSPAPTTEQPPVIAPQALNERINLDSFGDNQISNGGDLIFWSGVRTGEKARIAGDTGIVSAVGVSATTITVTNLISSVVAFVGSSATITDITATNITGTLATAAQPNVTSVGDLASLSVGGGFGSTGCSISAAGVLQCNGAAEVGGALTVTGTSSLVGVVTLSTNIVHSSASITPTDGGILTPTAKLVTLTPGGAVGVQLGSCTTGNETILYNSVNASVVITDTGNGLLAGNQTLGQYDALMLACYATKWVQVSAVSAN